MLFPFFWVYNKSNIFFLLVIQLSEGRKNISLGNYDNEWHTRRKLAYKAVK